MQMWKLTRPLETHARRQMFFAENKDGMTLTINAPEEDIEMYFDGQPEIFVYGEVRKNNLAIVGPAVREDW